MKCYVICFAMRAVMMCWLTLNITFVGFVLRPIVEKVAGQDCAAVTPRPGTGNYPWIPATTLGAVHNLPAKEWSHYI